MGSSLASSTTIHSSEKKRTVSSAMSSSPFCWHTTAYNFTSAVVLGPEIDEPKRVLACNLAKTPLYTTAWTSDHSFTPIFSCGIEEPAPLLQLALTLATHYERRPGQPHTRERESSLYTFFDEEICAIHHRQRYGLRTNGRINQFQ